MNERKRNGLDRMDGWMAQTERKRKCVGRGGNGSEWAKKQNRQKKKGVGFFPFYFAGLHEQYAKTRGVCLSLSLSLWFGLGVAKSDTFLPSALTHSHTRSPTHKNTSAWPSGCTPVKSTQRCGLGLTTEQDTKVKKKKKPRVARRDEPQSTTYEHVWERHVKQDTQAHPSTTKEGP